MIKIKYPSKGFSDLYLKIFTQKGLNINDDLNSIFNYTLNHENITLNLNLLSNDSLKLISLVGNQIEVNFEELLIAPFEVLLNFAIDFDDMIKSVTNHINEVTKLEVLRKNKKEKKRDLTRFEKFNKNLCKALKYENKWQQEIANFFMEHSDSLKLSTCYYCNIDFINSYNAFAEYKDEKSFIKTISLKELILIKGITPSKAKLIISQRDRITCINDLNNIRKTNKKALHTRFQNLNNKTVKFENESSFLRSLNEDQLRSLKNVTERNIQLILTNQNNTANIDDLPVPKTCTDALHSWYNLLNSENRLIQYNHFTLDHVMDKMSYPLFSLCLFNFVPSCYSCNSKLKGNASIVNNDSSLSPTSPMFNLHEDVSIKVLFETDKKNSINVNEFKFKFNILNSNKYDDYKNYIEVFKLPQRYNYHKPEIATLIDKSRKYSDSYITKMIESLGHTDEIMLIPSLKYSIRKDIFGKELFEGDLQEKPLTKLKRDIAKQIGIEGVKED